MPNPLIDDMADKIRQKIAAKDAEITRLHRELDIANLAVELNEPGIKWCQDRVSEAQALTGERDAEIARLRAALEVFASICSWQERREPFGNPGGYITWQCWMYPLNLDQTDTIDDPADFARRALEGK